MLSSCFFLTGKPIGFTCKKNFRKTFQRLLGRIPRRFCDQLTFSIIQVFTHFLELLKICPKMFPFFFAKMIDLCLLTQKNQTLERFCIPFYGIFKKESLSDWIRVRSAASRRWLSTKTVLHFVGRFGGFVDGFLVQDEPSSCPGAVESAHCSSSDRARRRRSGQRRTYSSSHMRSGRRFS